jgi:2'-5' RNA ligase
VSRLFVAILLPPHVEADIDERVDALRDALPDLKWVPASRWHVTLEFLGDCGPYEADRQRLRWAERAGRSAPFDIAIAGGGAFPHAWIARVLWAGIRVEAERWHRLAGEAQQPHVTLARTKPARDLTGLVQSLGAYAGPSWLVEEVALVESMARSRGKRGPRYEVQDVFELAAGRPSTQDRDPSLEQRDAPVERRGPSTIRR